MQLWSRYTISISKRGHIKGCKSGFKFKSFFHFNQVSVRKLHTKQAIDLKHQPELGACPCMRVGGFKRNPIGFSSGETEHKRRKTLQKDLRVTQQLIKGSFCLCTFLTTGFVTTATLVEPQELRSNPCAVTWRALGPLIYFYLCHSISVALLA